jgi:hypothetical protein
MNRRRQLYSITWSADIIDKYYTFFLNSVSTQIDNGLKYLNMTVSSRQANLLCAEQASPHGTSGLN